MTVAEPELLVVMASPPPLTLVVLVMDAGAFAAMFTGMFSVVDSPTPSAVLRLQLTTALVEALQFQPASGLVTTPVVRPVHRVSVTL